MAKTSQTLITNKLNFSGELLKVVSSVNEDDRPIKIWENVRKIWFEELGITANDKYLSQQAKTDVVYKIGIRRDISITEKENHIRISGVNYLITRIYTDRPNNRMELSLNYVD